MLSWTTTSRSTPTPVTVVGLDAQQAFTPSIAADDRWPPTRGCSGRGSPRSCRGGRHEPSLLRGVAEESTRIGRRGGVAVPRAVCAGGRREAHRPCSLRPRGRGARAPVAAVPRLPVHSREHGADQRADQAHPRRPHASAALVGRQAAIGPLRALSTSHTLRTQGSAAHALVSCRSARSSFWNMRPCSPHSSRFAPGRVAAGGQLRALVPPARFLAIGSGERRRCLASRGNVAGTCMSYR